MCAGAQRCCKRATLVAVINNVASISLVYWCIGAQPCCKLAIGAQPCCKLVIDAQRYT